MSTLNKPCALWRYKCICYGTVLLIFHLKYLYRKSHGKIWHLWDKHLLQSNGILSKTLFINNREIDVKYLGCSVHKEVKRGKCVLLFSRAGLAAQSTVIEFMPWRGWDEWGRKDTVLMTSYCCFSSVLPALFGSQGLFCACEYKHVPLIKRRKEGRKKGITSVGVSNRWLLMVVKNDIMKSLQVNSRKSQLHSQE